MGGQITEIDAVNKVMEIDPPKKADEETPENDLSSKQSANTLFNFTKKFEWLTGILERKAFSPRYNDENIEVYGLGDEKTICFPMTCFCDIHLKRLNPHMEKYGKFGIGLEKDWGIQSGVQPIQYININSPLHKGFAEIFTKSLRNTSEDDDILIEHQNFLLTNLLYLKPLEGLMRLSNEDEDLSKHNFHDEREWRYIPDLSMQEDLTLLIPADHMSPQARLSYSDAIEENPEFWLDFEYRDIKHLIVKDEQYRELLIHFIIDKLDIDSFEKMLLVSKIIVWENIVKDW
ncbi:abortive infection system antitoxin AbiGi family protein [Bacillus cereus]|uniref:abortive infection system antitoxin AbiGi family protein n=1 Tax=Bacillus cereus TaxID=1396 RepID=UPI002D79B808|nr:abortive infection system antitoxin AbiGi family protein [Bacillus cereus]MCU5537234.1 abortive infection system antitoxin AbiGi family protein [Bacillus cereus]